MIFLFEKNIVKQTNKQKINNLLGKKMSSLQQWATIDGLYTGRSTKKAPDKLFRRAL